MQLESDWRDWRAARERVDELREAVNRSAAETEELQLRLSELDRLDPREGEETELAEERAVLGAAEKALADIASARETFDGLGPKVATAIRALERARERAVTAGAAVEGAAVSRLTLASEALDRVLIEAGEAEAAIEHLFSDPAVAYLHAHYATRGCYAARIDPAH